MILSDIKKFTVMESLKGSSDSKDILNYISDQFEAKDKNPTFGVNYLMKAPNGKPILYSIDGIKNAQSYGHISILEYGRPYSNASVKGWYLDIMKYTSKGNMKITGKAVMVSKEDAEKMFKALGIAHNKLPDNDLDYDTEKNLKWETL